MTKTSEKGFQKFWLKFDDLFSFKYLYNIITDIFELRFTHYQPQCHYFIKQTLVYGLNFKERGIRWDKNHQKNGAGVFGWEVRFYTKRGLIVIKLHTKNVFCHKVVKKIVFWTPCYFFNQRIINMRSLGWQIEKCFSELTQSTFWPKLS